MIDELRALADTLSKATPGPWEVEFNDTLISAKKDGKWRSLCGLYGHSEVWRRENATAICAARNSEALLRQAADELERKDARIAELEKFVRYVACFRKSEELSLNHIGFKAFDLVAELEARP